MTYINVGATLAGRRIKTKKALRDAVKRGDIVVFDSTSLFNSFEGTVEDISTGTTLSVVGPDPYSNRKWYATVTSDGKVK